MNHSGLLIIITLAASCPAMAQEPPIVLLCSGELKTEAWTHAGNRFPARTSALNNMLLVLNIAQRQVFIAPDVSGRSDPLHIKHVDDLRVEAETDLLESDGGKKVGLKQLTINRVTGQVTLRDSGPWQAFGVLQCRRATQQF